MINWGIIGLGNMATKFANSIKELDNAKLIGISSQSKQKLKEFGDRFDIKEKYRFNDYSEILNSKEINSIYISTLNNTHANLITSAANKKKNILCEKPFAINLEEAEIINNDIKTSKVFFFEAIAYRAHPQTAEVLKIIKDNEIGEIEKIECSFGFKFKKIKKDSRLFNKDYGGGAILDLGCYPISFMHLFSKTDEDTKILQINGSRALTGVDDYAEISLLINNKIQGKAKVSFKENYNNNCIIYGKKGSITIPSPWSPEKKCYIEIKKDGNYFKKFINSPKDVYTLQIESVSNSLNKDNQTGNDLLIDIDKSLKIMKVLNTWSKKIL